MEGSERYVVSVVDEMLIVRQSVNPVIDLIRGHARQIVVAVICADAVRPGQLCAAAQRVIAEPERPGPGIRWRAQPVQRV